MSEPKQWYILRFECSNKCLIRDGSEKYPDDVDGKPGEMWMPLVERAAFDALKAKHDELLSYLPKVPTQPYEKQLAAEVVALKAERASDISALIREIQIRDVELVNWKAQAEKLADWIEKVIEGPAKTMAEPKSVWYSTHSRRVLEAYRKFTGAE